MAAEMLNFLQHAVTVTVTCVHAMCGATLGPCDVDLWLRNHYLDAPPFSLTADLLWQVWSPACFDAFRLVCCDCRVPVSRVGSATASGDWVWSCCDVSLQMHAACV